jgi:hypothetical protein
MGPEAGFEYARLTSLRNPLKRRARLDLGRVAIDASIAGRSCPPEPESTGGRS